MHAATSKGHVDCPDGIEAILEDMILPTYDMHTIYQNIMHQGLTWKVYYHDVSQTRALYQLRNYVETNFRRLDDFLEDVKNGRLPNYSFIEPCYGNLPGFIGTDQHPPHDVRYGEHLIAGVYNAIRNNEDIWNKCLIVILYDEHGGFYDHVTPPATVNPDGLNSTNPPFSFDRLGIRVPAIIVSPFVPKGVVDHTVYDHTSVLATVKNIFKLPNFLTERDKNANTFDRIFIDTPRTDKIILPDIVL